MELVKYTLCDIELMMVDIEGTLYCSTPQLEKVFGADRRNLTRLINRHPEEFSQATCESLMSSNGPRKELLEGLGMKRLRKNTRLWSEDDVIGVTWLIRSDIARQCRAQFKEILKQHARRETISMSEHEAIVAQQIAPLRAAVEELMADKRAMASNAGRALRRASNAGRTLRLVRNKV